MPTEDEILESWFRAAELALAQVPLAYRILAREYLHDLRRLVELREARNQLIERRLAGAENALRELYGRVEVLERC